MKKNNKITRTRARRKQEVVVQHDGTEVLHTKESKQKDRRWSFEADVEFKLPVPEGTDAAVMKRTLQLESVSYGNAVDAREDAKRNEAYLRATNQLFANGTVKVRAIPHETISKTTLRQLTGYRDMSMILDKALGLALVEAESVALGKAVGSQFVTKDLVPGVEATDTQTAVPPVPARTINIIKEEFYRRASDILMEENKPIAEEQVVNPTEEEKKPFVPEIVEIQRVPETESNSSEPVSAV